MKQKTIRFDVMTGQEKGEKMNNKKSFTNFCSDFNFSSIFKWM